MNLGGFAFVHRMSGGEILAGVSLARAVEYLDDLVWGPWMLVLLLGSGCYLMLRLDLLPLKNLKFALKCAFGGGPAEKGKVKGKKASSGKVTSLASLTTELATTLGIGNIVALPRPWFWAGPEPYSGW